MGWQVCNVSFSFTKPQQSNKQLWKYVSLTVISPLSPPPFLEAENN